MAKVKTYTMTLDAQEQKEANRQAARRVAWQILERAAAEGRLPTASN